MNAEGNVMAKQKFLSEESKKKCAEIVRDIESKTSAEIVIAARTASDDYAAAAGSGALCAVVLVSAFILMLDTFQIVSFPAFAVVLLLVGAMVVGKIAFSSIAPIRRLFVPPQRAAQAIMMCAQSKFVDLGISRTSGRNGILFFISLFEERVIVVPDIGVDEDLLGEPWEQMKDELNKAVRASDFAAFETAMKKAGPILGAVMPRAEDDVNELPDDLQG